jgi:sterol desaturase/sphingolipid hydroxylase (fatty acid hydroxylase superfamily)
LSNYRHRKLYGWKDTVANIYFLLLNSGIDLLFRSAYILILDYFYRHRILSITQTFTYWFFLVLAEDFLYYWLHRFDHGIRIFRAIHVTNHSSEHINFTVGFRSSVFQPMYRFIYFIPLALCGFKSLDIVFIYSVTRIWGILVHTELIHKMGWLEYVLVTPSHHRFTMHPIRNIWI